jgi:hypothetical protein
LAVSGRQHSGKFAKIENPIAKRAPANPVAAKLFDIEYLPGNTSKLVPVPTLSK